MNTLDIENLVKRLCAEKYLGVFAADRLPTHLPPRRPLVLVCNTDKHSEPGEHWVVIYIGEDSRGEYFDSYGLPPPPAFETFLNKFSNTWIFNDFKIQSVISHFCGHYCVMYCTLRCLDFSMRQIVCSFTDDTALNDSIVHKFVCEKIQHL